MTSLISFTGLGKRKTSVAKVFFNTGTGIITINKKPLHEFFASLGEEQAAIQDPFLVVDLKNQYDLCILVKGGGVHSQFEAIRLAISKGLCQIKKEYRPLLHDQFFLNRDSRIKERRKYGLKKARKASQYSKR
jgi:small subunit ribosomal protein S9